MVTIESQESIIEQPSAPVNQEAPRPQKRSYASTAPSSADNTNAPAPKKSRFNVAYMAPRKLHSLQEPEQYQEESTNTFEATETVVAMTSHSNVTNNKMSSIAPMEMKQLESLIPKVQHRASGLKMKRNRTQMAELLGLSDEK